MNRRELIAGLGGAAAWPLIASAQQTDGMRRIGVLMDYSQADPESGSRMAAFVEGLQELGWTEGRNVRIDYRWGAGNADTIRKYAAELAALAPDVILANGSASVGALQKVTRTVPVVFASVADPVGAGFVDSLGRPGGNATGFMLLDYAISAKWLELLKDCAHGDPSGSASRSRTSVRKRAIGRYPSHGAFVRGGVATHRRARGRRH